MLEADRGQAAIAIHLVDSAGFDDWLTTQPAGVRTILTAQRFTGSADSLAVVSSGESWFAVFICSCGKRVIVSSGLGTRVPGLH